MNFDKDSVGDAIHDLAKRLWPINRSITGDGVRETLGVINEHLPTLSRVEVPSGTPAFDWTVPKEWRVREAWIITPEGRKICNFSENNLHLVGYSTPVHKRVSLDELNEHLFSLPDQPDAIPYITSYYKERWGFCISEHDRAQLVQGDYEVLVDSELFQGSLTYGELIIKGRLDREVLISTYVCHPSMANNELSGPCVTTFLAKWLLSLDDLKNSYRIVFIPETIGSIVYLSRNFEHLKQHVYAGFNVTCVGDDREYSFLPSRRGNTESDIVARHVLSGIDSNYKRYQWKDRGSDERQYCAPLVDLPIASIMRSKYAQYPEYHTSLDDLESVVTPAGLAGAFNALRLALEALERNCFPVVTVLGEPQLGRRGLYPTLSTKSTRSQVQLMMDLITWSDGEKSLLEIAELCGARIWELYSLLDSLVSHDLIRLNDVPA
ncbi:MAG: DUF4910 domain-containing protein [Cyanobacteria bacterium HKST-UBA02]|nr:DUF4910 domain-containing protein [Cyanobacteria bacterium HKST-UBA02]